MTAKKIAAASDWDATKVHDLPSGRAVALLADPPNLFGVAVQFGLSDEALDGLASGDLPLAVLTEIAPAVCQAMFVEPTVRVRDEDGAVPDGCLPFDKLSNDDVAYVLEQFIEETGEVAEQAETFRDDEHGGQAGADSQDVQPAPKRTGGAAKRKPARQSR